MLDEQFRSRKFTMAIIGIGVLIIIALGFWLKNQFDSVLWGAWFVAFGGVIAIYSGANVLQKKVANEK